MSRKIVVISENETSETTTQGVVGRPSPAREIRNPAGSAKRVTNTRVMRY
ncbi:MAG: hypothetical protein RJB13_2310 [Pseudomonadota bacterium]